MFYDREDVNCVNVMNICCISLPLIALLNFNKTSGEQSKTFALQASQMLRDIHSITIGRWRFLKTQSACLTFFNLFICDPPSVGWGVDQSVGGFGDEPGIKVQLMNLIRSVRTVMRGGSPHQHTHHMCKVVVYSSLIMLFLCVCVCFYSAVNSSEFSLHRAAASVWMKRSRVSMISGTTIPVTHQTSPVSLNMNVVNWFQHQTWDNCQGLFSTAQWSKIRDAVVKVNLS